MKTDTSEKGLESLIVRAMTGRTDLLSPAHVATETSVPVSGGTGWLLGDASHYDREHCVDLVQLRGFLMATQPALVEAFALDRAGAIRLKFLTRLQGEVHKRGVIDVLRNGVKHGPHDVALFYGTPTPGNTKAEELYRHNRFSVTRQLRYSRDERALALDLGLFINGLPVFTFELKNSLTKQTVADAVEQYKRDRSIRERLFEFGRCAAHFAVDDHEVRFCTELKDKSSWFLPFNRGYNDGAGNPPNPDGLKTDYLWKQILTPSSLTNILENYAQVVELKDARTHKVKREQVFPRYHQLEVVRKLLADVATRGAGRRYLIQHSAGSGKSNSIAWLAHQLIGLDRNGRPIFDSIIVVTDRRILDQQIRNTIKRYTQVDAIVGHAARSGDLRSFIASGKKIIITTVQKFPFILDEIGADLRGRTFAIIIDEAHSGQGGKSSAAVSLTLSEGGTDDEETTEDRINRIVKDRKMLANASYFAFTATPKNKTLETFGEIIPGETDADGAPRRRAFHSYTMKQAIDEGFILDVLRFYTPVKSYYKLVKTAEDDPEFDTKKAQKKLRRYVESNDHAIRLKAEIMIDHFHEQVLAQNKIGGKARAMVVCNGIDRAIQYFVAFRSYLAERKSPYRAIVAFSGEHGDNKETEATFNGFPSGEITDRIQEDPFRFLICADKFQTGYDEPLLHTMYVDKTLSGIKAVQTLSRLNRAHPQKHDTFVLDFINDADIIKASFEDYYRTTILSGETDPNKLHDLQAALDARQVYAQSQVDGLVALYLGGAERDKLDPFLDPCVVVYKDDLDEDAQIDFKGKAKAFTRTYGFLSAILPYTNTAWEKLSIFLNFLVPKLPAPAETDLSRGILESIDMDSYRTEKQATMRIALDDADAEIGPVPVSGGGHRPEPELERLSNILKVFNDQFGNIPWQDIDHIGKVITEDIPKRVAQDTAYKNASQNSDKENARIEHDNALSRVLIDLMRDDTELFKQFCDNPSFKRWLGDMVFAETYRAPGSTHPT
jgi:type I restriction enzyme R subunit